MMTYNGIPNKKRRVVADQDGHLIPVDKRSGASHYFMVSASGTLVADGHLTVTGTQFNWDTVVTASYRGANAAIGAPPIAVTLGDGTVTFSGSSSAAFYYTAVNHSKF